MSIAYPSALNSRYKRCRENEIMKKQRGRFIGNWAHTYIPMDVHSVSRRLLLGPGIGSLSAIHLNSDNPLSLSHTHHQRRPRTGYESLTRRHNFFFRHLKTAIQPPQMVLCSNDGAILSLNGNMTLSCYYRSRLSEPILPLLSVETIDSKSFAPSLDPTPLFIVPSSPDKSKESPRLRVA